VISRFVWLLAVAIAGGVVWASPAPPVLEGLMASGPAADIAEKMMLFGRLVGSWDIDYTAYPPGRDSITAKCEWHFGWVLDGRAVQDVWICPPRAARGKATTRAPLGEMAMMRVRLESGAPPCACTTRSWTRGTSCSSVRCMAT